MCFAFCFSFDRKLVRPTDFFSPTDFAALALSIFVRCFNIILICNEDFWIFLCTEWGNALKGLFLRLQFTLCWESASRLKSWLEDLFLLYLCFLKFDHRFLTTNLKFYLNHLASACTVWHGVPSTCWTKPPSSKLVLGLKANLHLVLYPIHDVLKRLHCVC